MIKLQAFPFSTTKKTFVSPYICSVQKGQNKNKKQINTDMKKQIAIAAFTIGAIVLGTNNVQAQTKDTNEASTVATIELAEVISISANNKPVAFAYKTAYDYNNDQKVAKATTLKVTSSKKFDIKVNAKGENFTDGTNNIPVNVLKIIATGGGTDSKVPEIVLSKDVKTIVAESPGGSELTWELDYTIPKDKSSSSDILGKPAGTYTQTIMYTVSN